MKNRCQNNVPFTVEWEECIVSVPSEWEEWEENFYVSAGWRRDGTEGTGGVKTRVEAIEWRNYAVRFPVINGVRVQKHTFQKKGHFNDTFYDVIAHIDRMWRTKEPVGVEDVSLRESQPIAATDVHWTLHPEFKKLGVVPFEKMHKSSVEVW